MQTIRQNVFETNSSSTHSVTIRNRSAPVSKVARPLIEDGVLYPERLEDYVVGVDFGNDGCVLSCDDVAKKSAILVHWIYTYWENDAINDDQLTGALNFLTARIPDFERIEHSDFESEYHPCPDYDDAPFELGGHDWEDLQNMEQAIKWILNDKIEIIDSNIED